MFYCVGFFTKDEFTLFKYLMQLINDALNNLKVILKTQLISKIVSKWHKS